MTALKTLFAAARAPGAGNVLREILHPSGRLDYSRS
ncbi:hypothetical protein SAMN06295937_100257 [Sphingopyxis flava]|uniref:Uncharacterized protein n=1 Tax=Sphingopyxis flava TaxID=1507287 RepID=A0A1T5A0E2_9SPHN|nr:hypothetical protein SAMN06295937_100257 [Sphingopyxis flava]